MKFTPAAATRTRTWSGPGSRQRLVADVEDVATAVAGDDEGGGGLGQRGTGASSTQASEIGSGRVQVDLGGLDGEHHRGAAVQAELGDGGAG